MKKKPAQSRSAKNSKKAAFAATRYKFGNKAILSQGRALECVIAPLALLRGGLSGLALQGTRWVSEEAVQQFNYKAAKELKDSQGPASRGSSDDKNSKSFQVAFSSGAVSSFLFFNPQAKTFELHSDLQKTFGDLLKRAESDHEGQVALDIRHLDTENQERVLFAFIFLCETVHWEPTRFGTGASVKTGVTKKASNKAASVQIASELSEAESNAIASRAIALARANNHVRTLADLPANELNPTNYRTRIQAFAREHGLSFEFWDRKELTRKKAGAFLAVTRADPNTSGGIAILKYKPRGASKNRKLLTLVGKGICFDTGGYNIKPGNYMLGMHGDMTGSALALSLCGYFAATQADIEVHAYLALAENLISATAYKPNEVVVASDGTSIEVVDTDAEGRMVLADTLAFARAGKPDLLIDYATLTGAAIRALDRRKSAVFSNREDLSLLAVQCGNQSGERLWHFPIDDDYRKSLKSKVADILQCSESSNADHIYAAAFLGHFVGAETPWVHVDLVACENKGGLGLIGSDTTGFGVLWTDLFVREVLGQ